MALSRTHAGIDLGARHVRMVEVRETGRGLLVERAASFDRQALGGDRSEGFAALAAEVRGRLDAARIPRRDVILGLSGQDVMLRYLRLPPAPYWRIAKIVAYEVKEMAERIGEPLAWDHRLLPRGGEDAAEDVVLVAVAKEPQLDELLGSLEAQGVTVAGVVPSALALFALHDVAGRKCDPEAPEDDLLLLLDLGAQSLQAALVLNDRLVFARSASLGGAAFTDALAQTLDIDPADAEDLKIAHGGLSEGDVGVRGDTVGGLRRAAGQLLEVVQSTIRFARSQTGLALGTLTRVEICGKGSRLRGLANYLEKGLQAPVEPMRPESVRAGTGLSGEALEAWEAEPEDFCAAVGLCASRARPPRRGDVPIRSIRLLPERYARRRTFRERTAFLYGAAAVLLLFLAVKLGHALVDHSRAGRVYAKLEGFRKELLERKAELAADSRALEERTQRLNRLLKEAEVTSFGAFVLDLLPRILRPEMQLEKVQWLLPVAPDNLGYAYEMRILGRVNNEKRRGLEWIRELENALQAEDRIASIQVVASRPDGPWYTFELSLEPNYVAY